MFRADCPPAPWEKLGDNLLPAASPPLDCLSRDGNTAEMIVNCAVYEGGRRRDGDLALDEAGEAARCRDAFVWLGVLEPSAEEFEAIAREFDLHELAVEDAVNAHQRPKVELYGETLLVVVKPAHYIDSDEVIQVGELLLFVHPTFIITVRHGAGDLSAVRRRIERRPDQLSLGVGMVLYAILDHVVDGYEEAAEGIDVDIQQVERQVFRPTEPTRRSGSTG